MTRHDDAPLVVFLHARLGAQREQVKMLRTMAVLLPPDTGRALTELADQLAADAEAKRRIVGWHAEPHYCTDQGNLESWYTPEHPCPTLRAMTLPHANHQDYRQEWAP